MRKKQKSSDAFRTISEAAKELGIQQHVLRFWESKFPSIEPVKNASGRRFYRANDILLLQAIRFFLHEQGYTIKGVQKLLREHKNKGLIRLAFGDVSVNDGGDDVISADDTRDTAPLDSGDWQYIRDGLSSLHQELRHLQTELIRKE
jgi:DNA-binding transcriptional MerR regulator